MNARLTAAAPARLRCPSARMALGRSLLLPLLVLLAAAGAGHADAALENEEQETLYLIGSAVARTLERFDLSEDELKIVIRGVEDAVLKREPLVVDLQAGERVRKFHSERVAAGAASEKQKAKQFLARQAELEGAMRTDSGLIITELSPGEGASPEPTDTVRVHYHGTLRDGTVFDSSVDRKQPAEFPLNRVIPCWTEGVGMMKVGGRSKLVCPPDIAYGDQGRPGIPGGAALSFEVELIQIK